MIYKRFWLAGVLALSISGVMSQDMLVTLKGDTLRGEINILAPQGKMENVILKNDQGRESLNMMQINMFTTEGKTYRTVQIYDTYKIMEVVHGGYLSLYNFRSDKSILFDSRYLIKMGGNGMEVPTITFKKKMMEFLEDCPEIVEKLDNKEFSRRDLIEIVSEYNSCIERITQAATQRLTKSEMEIPEEIKALINSIQIEVEKNDLDSAGDVRDILNDIKDRLKSGKGIPGFLKSALKENLASDPNLTLKADQLIDLIEN